jgi:hypothetical protein
MGMVWSVRSEWVTFAGLLLMVATVLILGIKALSFAEKHPHTALMEGAELLVHEQIRLHAVMKFRSVPPFNEVEGAPGQDIHPQTDVPDIVNLPDIAIDQVKPEVPVVGDPKPARTRRKKE